MSLNLNVFSKLDAFPGYSSILVEANGGFEAFDTVLFVKCAGEEQDVLDSAIGLYDIKQFSRALKAMGVNVQIEHVMDSEANQNLLLMKADRKTLKYILSDVDAVRKNQFNWVDGHILDKISGINTKLTIKLNTADRQEIMAALNLNNVTESVYLEQREDGFYFVSGKDSQITCEVRVADGNFAEIGNFFVKYQKDYFKALLSVTSENADFIFYSLNNGPAPLKVEDGLMSFVLLPYNK